MNWEEMNIPECAFAVGVPVGTFKTRMYCGERKMSKTEAAQSLLEKYQKYNLQSEVYAKGLSLEYLKKPLVNSQFWGVVY